MARSLCIVTFLMIFLLISTGIPKGKAQCMGEQRSTVPTGIFSGYGKMLGPMMMRRRPMRDKDQTNSLYQPLQNQDLSTS
ncbi:unnamed protein product [Brassica rapa]|uniref:Uncharacterized protein n=2 Tax=Brassica TaxID=3705 RepID=A0A3P5YNT9_BRACM|nr:unnamed protein product [Brassica napus]CAG7865983.1 unnamed protein product [Brassica rapa]VDC63013.1 unnamed protein product [Brassica rapa]